MRGCIHAYIHWVLAMAMAVASGHLHGHGCASSNFLSHGAGRHDYRRRHGRPFRRGLGRHGGRRRRNRPSPQAAVCGSRYCVATAATLVCLLLQHGAI